MCGRFTLDRIDQLEKRFGAILPNDISANYNIAPGQMVLTLIKNSPIKFKKMKWGIIPGWSKSEKVHFSNINSRKENILQSRVYSRLLANKRCLIPASGYYEWKKDNNTKIPYYFTLKNHEIFSFAGLYDIWHNGENNIFSCSIITLPAPLKICNIHPRMPAILDKKGEQVWLDKKNTKDTLLKLLEKPNAIPSYYKISPEVNNPKNNSSSLIEKI